MNQYRFNKQAKNQSAAFSAVAVLGALALLVNYVLAYFGAKPVTMLLVFVCQCLLGVVGSYFRTQTVKVQQ